jgi:prevent-host-death family protein
MERVTAGEFKARCLELIDEVNRTGRAWVITKRGKPVAQLLPLPSQQRPRAFGCLKGTVQYLGDIVDTAYLWPRRSQ